MDLSCGLPHTGLWRQSGALADLDGDGFPEIVLPPPRKASPEERRLRVFHWISEDSCWQEKTVRLRDLSETLDYGDVEVGDLNGDGRPDLALAMHLRGLKVLLGESGESGELVFREDHSFRPPEGFLSRALALADLDGDGRLEIVAAPQTDMAGKNRLRGILVAHGGPPWRFEFLRAAEGLFADDLAVADLDRDGHLDIAWAPLAVCRGCQRLVFWGPSFDQYLEASSLVYREVPFRLEVDGGRATIWLSTWSQRRSCLLRLRLEGREAVVWERVKVRNLVRAMTLADLDADQVPELVFVQNDGLYFLRQGSSVRLLEGDFSGAYFLEASELSGGLVLLVGQGRSLGPGGLRAFLVKRDR